MPFITNGDAHIYFEEAGEGFPLLLLSSGNMRSRIDALARLERSYPAYRFNPLTHFVNDFHMVAMDQRNAMGQSTAPVEPTDGWHSFASDQLAVVDSLGIDRFHIWGGCISVPFALELARLAPDRVVSMVLQDAIGPHPDHPTAAIDLFMDYARELVADRPDLDIDKVATFGRNLFCEDFEDKFVYTVDREFVTGCKTPMLVMPSWDDEYHPIAASEVLASLAPNAIYDPTWQHETADRNKAVILDFLRQHTPA